MIADNNMNGQSLEQALNAFRSCRSVHFIITAKGTGMEPYIMDGALVYVEKTPPGCIQNGDFAVCYTEGFTMPMTRRISFKASGKVTEVRLESFNPGEERWLPADQVEFLGRVYDWENDQQVIKRMVFRMNRDRYKDLRKKSIFKRRRIANK